MPDITFFLYYFSLIGATVIGFLRYKQLDEALRIILLLMVATVLNETIAYLALSHGYVALKTITYYIYDIISIIITTYYFIKILNPRHFRLFLVSTLIIWIGMGIIKAVMFKAYNSLDTYTLLLESFCVITMSLYSVYQMLKKETINNIFAYSHFWMVILLLVNWSATFFFWASIKTLYNSHWKHLNIMLFCQSIVNILCYGGIGVILYLHGKKLKTGENF